MDIKFNFAPEFESDALTFLNHELFFKKQKITVHLNKNQMKLFSCLFKRMHEKKDIILSIWPVEESRLKENNLNQLIFNTRELLRNSGISEQVIVTMPRYGLCINRDFLTTEKKRSVDVINGYIILY
jgi:DNA-binding winged helix-turn-helix (wHTH) protein